MTSTWEPKRQQIRSFLRTIGKNAGLTQRQLAERLDKPQSYVSKYELGERRLDFVETLEVCEACGEYNIDYLIRLVTKDRKSGAGE